MTAFELQIRRWIFLLGQRLHGKRQWHFGHSLCGRAMGIRPCCIRHFQSYEYQLGAARRVQDLERNFDHEWEWLTDHPEFQYAPCPWHRGAAQYPILVLFERGELEEALSEWQKEFWRRVFHESALK
jgi:hypothetical protein